LESKKSEEILQEIIRHAYNVTADDSRPRAGLNLHPEERCRYFDRLRREYPVRREFHNYRAAMPESGEFFTKKLLALEFRLSNF
jgi:erythronate-4-phosphate dehydrogenase